MDGATVLVIGGLLVAAWVALADPIVGQEAIRRFRVRPILAGQRNASANRLADLFEQVPEPPGEAQILELAASTLVVDPVERAGRDLSPRVSVRLRPYHDAPLRGDSGAQ